MTTERARTWIRQMVVVLGADGWCQIETVQAVQLWAENRNLAADMARAAESDERIRRSVAW